MTKVFLSDLRVNPIQLRTQSKKDVWDSIQKNGLLNPILVHSTLGKWEIIDGHQRYKALQFLGHRMVAVNIVELSSIEILFAQIRMNKGATTQEYSMHLRRILTIEPNYTLDTLAKVCVSTVTWVVNVLLPKLRARILDHVQADKISLLKAYALSQLPYGEQAKWTRRAMLMSDIDFITAINTRRKERKCSTCENTLAVSGMVRIGDQKFCTTCRKKQMAKEQLTARELLHGPDPVVEPKKITIMQPILRKGWDNVHDPRTGGWAYCRGDVLVWRRSQGIWVIKHPILRLTNDFHQAEYAMKWIEENINDTN